MFEIECSPQEWLEHAERIQQTGESQHVNVYPYDVPPIVTTTVDAIKTPVVKTYDRDRAELHGAKQLR